MYGDRKIENGKEDDIIFKLRNEEELRMKQVSNFVCVGVLIRQDGSTSTIEANMDARPGSVNVNQNYEECSRKSPSSYVV